MGKKSTLTAEQRTQLVLRLLSKEERAGTSEQTLYRWREEFIGAGKQAMNGPGGAKQAGEGARAPECRGGRARPGDRGADERRVRSAELYRAARLFELLPSAPNDLWQADVTHIHIPGRGWWYAVTVIDYYSRYLLACHFTPSSPATDVTAARAEAERLHGPLAKSRFLVTDNGSSFLARAFRRHIDGDYAHVRIGYRTPTRTGLLERFHQTLKSEEVYWKLHASPGEARESLEVFRRRYNGVRPHRALAPPEGGDPIMPADVYVHGQAVGLPKRQGWAKAAGEKLNVIVEDAHFPSPAEVAAPWTSPAALDSALTEIGPGRVHLISEPRQQENNVIVLPTPRQVTVHVGDVSIYVSGSEKGYSQGKIT